MLKSLTVVTLAAVVLTACGASSAASSVSRAASPTFSPSRTRSAGVFASCQLPVLMHGSPPQPGWLALPAGGFSPDS